MRLPTIRQQMLVFLAVLASYLAIKDSGLGFQILVALGAAVIFELALSRKLFFPESAIISGLFVGLILGAGQVLFAVLAVFAALLSKHFLKIERRHIFNPAGFGLLLVAFLGARFVWNGAELALPVTVFGLLLAWQMRNWFLIGSYFIIFSLIGLVVFNRLDFVFGVNLFFVFLMLVEPKTSPIRIKHGAIYGVIAAGLAVLLIRFVPQVDPWLVGLIGANMAAPLLNKLN